MVQKNVVEVGDEPAPAAKPAAPKPAPAPKAPETKAQAPAKPAAAKPPAAKPPAPKPAAPKEAATGLRALKVAKVTVNIGVGQAGDRLEKAEKVLGSLTNRKPVRTKARDSHRDWGVREGQAIGVKVTLRGPDAI